MCADAIYDGVLLTTRPPKFGSFIVGCAVVHILRHGYAAFILFPDQNPDTEVIFTEHVTHGYACRIDWQRHATSNERTQTDRESIK